MPKTITSALATHLGLEETTLATIWRLTRTDGVEFFFTDHDVSIPFEGNTYEAAVGYNRTAVANQVGLSVDNLDVEGFLDSTALTDYDLRAGLFDFAEVRVSVVNWADLSQGELRVRRGRLGEIIYADSGVFHTELRGLTQAYSQQIVELYQPECRADLGDSRCKIAIKPSNVLRLTAYAAGDYVRVPTAVPVVSIVNPSFELDALGTSVASITGWTIDSGNWDLHDNTNGGLSPYIGTQYLEGGNSASGQVSQVIDLTTAGLSTTKIDAGSYNMDFSIQRANSFPLDTGRVLVEWLDASDVVVTTPLDTGEEAITPEDTWVSRSFSGAIPATARKMKITLSYTLVDGTQANTDFDGLSATVTETPDRTELYQNRVYRCTTAGTTDLNQPSYDTTIGNTTTDGSAVFTAENAFMRSAQVVSVTDNRTFSISVSESRAVDDWFKYGAVLWDTGNNSPLAMEVKTSVAAVTTGATTLGVADTNTFSRSTGSFVTDGFQAGMTIETTGFTDAANNGTFTVTAVNALTLDVAETTLVAESGTGDETITSYDLIELFLPMPFAVQVGDKLGIYAGCDKRLSTCISKFDNVLNFRGEPYVPGQDEFLNYPNAR